MTTIKDNKMTKTMHKIHHRVDDYGHDRYDVYRKTFFGWKYLTYYNNYFDAVKRIKADISAPTYFNEKGVQIS
jgi:hypothetical protein